MLKDYYFEQLSVVWLRWRLIDISDLFGVEIDIFEQSGVVLLLQNNEGYKTIVHLVKI